MVHPRVCGEQPADKWRSFAWFGSSPRVRGTEWQLSDETVHCQESLSVPFKPSPREAPRQLRGHICL